MALPRLNSHITYTTKVPSTGATIKFRPFLVKEEKILLLAMETQDKTATLEAIANTLRSCISEDTPVDVKKLSIFDIEYLFTQIRSKSVGESSTLSMKCSNEECSSANEVSVDLSKLTIKVPRGKNANVIKINPEVTLIMKYPNFTDAISTVDKYDNGSESEILYDQILMCIEAVEMSDQRIILSDESYEERVAFIESFGTSEITPVREWIEKIPTLKHDVEYTCQSCGAENKHTLSGTADFF